MSDVVSPAADPDLAAVFVAALAADEKGATNPVILQVGEVLGIVEHFLICSASNKRLVRAIVEDIEEKVGHQTGEKPRRVEGQDDYRWVLMDFGDWIVHVFMDEARRFYDLERLWADVPRLPFT